jgi:hypothetical protein
LLAAKPATPILAFVGLQSFFRFQTRIGKKSEAREDARWILFSRHPFKTAGGNYVKIFKGFSDGEPGSSNKFLPRRVDVPAALP